MKIVLLGPPGSGKGTQGERLERDLGFARLSTGDMLRKHVAEGTELGKRAKVYMDRGELVPDEMILDMIKKELNRENIVFDGFPRNIAQAEALEELLAEKGETLRAAVLIDVPDEEVVRRLIARRVCRNCGRIYNLITNPPETPETCDACGGPLYQRDDDAEETVRHRLRAHKESTEPLVRFYRERGRLLVVRGTGDPDAIYAEIRRALGL